MRLACDTSFLFAVYGHDVFSGRAIAYLKRSQSPILVSAFNRFELGNALRLTAFRGLSTPEEAVLRWADFEQDLAAGRLIGMAEQSSKILDTAQYLSAKFTLGGGHRAFDILHVAAAVVTEADAFLSFDQNQLKLADVAGLKLAKL